MAKKKRTSKEPKHRLVIGPLAEAIVDLDPKGFTACVERHYREALREFDAGRLRGTAVYESTCKWGFGSHRLRLTTSFTRSITEAELE